MSPGRSSAPAVRNSTFSSPFSAALRRPRPIACCEGSSPSNREPGKAAAVVHGHAGTAPDVGRERSGLQPIGHAVQGGQDQRHQGEPGGGCARSPGRRPGRDRRMSARSRNGRHRPAARPPPAVRHRRRTRGPRTTGFPGYPPEPPRPPRLSRKPRRLRCRSGPRRPGRAAIPAAHVPATRWRPASPAAVIGPRPSPGTGPAGRPDGSSARPPHPAYSPTPAGEERDRSRSSAVMQRARTTPPPRHRFPPSQRGPYEGISSLCRAIAPAAERQRCCAASGPPVSRGAAHSPPRTRAGTTPERPAERGLAQGDWYTGYGTPSGQTARR